MGRGRDRFSLALLDPELERRALLSRGDLPAVAAAVGSGQTDGRNPFHHDGINGLVLHRTFVNRLNDRLTASKDETQRVVQAFQVFASSYAQLPVNPPAGSSGPTLADLVASLKQEVSVAETRREYISSTPTVSQRQGTTHAALAPIALVPFSETAIDTMAGTLAQLPPVAGPGGTLVNASPTAAVNTAVNAILNAVAETSIHPLLFLKPGNFYLNPNVKYTVSFSGAPASVAPGVFVLGPQGAILPGARLHPFAPD